MVQALHLFFGIGAVVSPLIAAPFLSYEIPSTTTPCTFNDTNLNAAVEYEITMSKSQVQTPLTIMSACAITCMLCLVSSQKLFSNRAAQYMVLESEQNPAAVSQGDALSKLHGSSSTVKAIVIAMLLTLFFLTQGIENTCNTYLLTFLVNSDLKITQKTAAHINSAFGGSYAIGSIIAVPIAMVLAPSAYIFVLMSMLLLSSVIFAVFLHSNLQFISIAAILLGAGCSALFGNLIALTLQLVNVTNVIGALIVVSSMASSGLYPVIVGGMIEKEPIVLIYQNAVSTVLAIAIAAGLLIYVKIVSKKLPKDKK